MAPHADCDVAVIATSDTSSAVIPDPILTKNPTYTRFTLDDVLPHRQRGAPMPTGVANFGSATMFKSKGCFSKPKAKDFTHRITEESAARKPSSLKGAMKHFTPDMISLCGGLPSSEYFPFESVSSRIPQPPGFSEPDTASNGQDATISKHDVHDGTSLYDLHIALNYGQSMGPPQLLRYLTEHTELIHSPKYSDWEISMTVGNTSALDLALRMFCKRGDFALTEEYTFSSAVETMRPMGVTPVGVAMDEHGMLPSALDEILSDWDESARGGPKPFVVYLIPTGQNPTGATQPLSRRKEIYAIAEKHDLFLLEDEPYYFLQMEPYVSGVTHEIASPFKPTTPADFLSALIPSYLSLDTSGRVMRLDSMSKVLAPGSRTGWITASAQIVERFVRHHEVSSQTPSGFSMAILYKLLDEQWGHKGFLEWLMYIRVQYTRRRDVMVNACEKYLPREVATWTAPAAGMFHWIKVNSSLHPGVQKGEVEVNEVEEKVFLAGVAANVLVARGSWFIVEDGKKSPVECTNRQNKAKDLYFRVTFAAAPEEQIVEAVRRFGIALRDEFGLDHACRE